MVTIRSLLFLVLMVLSVVLYGSLIIIIGRLLGRRASRRIAAHWARLVLWLLQVICGLRHEVAGLERLPAGPAVVLCKHQSAWETIALAALLPHEQTWVLKQELLRIPFFGWGLERVGAIAIDRRAGRGAMRKLLDEGARALEQGHWVIIFPEGTRVAPGATKRFSAGGALLAERAGVPVVPIAHNAGRFWRRRGIRKHPGRIQLVIGTPIPVEGKTAQQINAAAETWINETVATLNGPWEARG